MTARFTQGMAPVGSLKPNPWNTNIVPPENEAKIDASLRELDFFKPITVRTLADGSLEILGGQHRWESARRIGHAEVPVFNVGMIDDKKAKKIGMADNARYGEDDAYGLAQLIKDIGADELLSILPFDATDMGMFMSTTNISVDQLEKDLNQQTPELPTERPQATHQVMRFQVPVEDVAWIQSLITKRQHEKGFSTESSQINAGNALVDILKEHK